MADRAIAKELWPARLNVAFITGLAAALLLPLAIIAHKGIAVMLGVVALASAAHLMHRKADVRSLRFVVAALGALVLLAGASSLWSPTPMDSLRSSALVLALAVAGLLACALIEDDEPSLQVARHIMVWGGAVGYAILAGELLSDATFSRMLFDAVGHTYILRPGGYDYLLNSAAAVAAIFFWPWLAAIGGIARWPVIAAAALLAGWVISVGEAQAPMVALAAGATAWAAVKIMGRIGSRIIVGCILVLIAVAPLLAERLPDPTISGRGIEFLSNSAAHRLAIWRTAVRHIHDHPLLGLGMNGSRTLYGRDDRIVLQFFPDVPSRQVANLFEPIPLHPHNGILQIWLELGAAGALALAGLVVALSSSIPSGQRTEHLAPFAYATLVSTLITSGVSFGLWQSWWISAQLLVAAMLAVVYAAARCSLNEEPK